MADNDYNSGLNILLGDKAQSQQLQPQSPEEDIQNLYDSPMQSDQLSFDQLIQGSSTMPAENQALDDYATGQAALGMGQAEYGKLQELQYGAAPDQEIVDPASMIGSGGQRIERGLKAGWGDLLTGTGDAIDYINARFMPGEPELTTPVGSWLKKVGTEYQNENALVLSEDLQDMRWNDILKAEFWTSKMSRMLPYTLSFIIPYGVGARVGGALLGRFGQAAFKGASKAGMGTARKGVQKIAGKTASVGKASTGGTGLVGKLAIDAGKAGILPTKLARDWAGYIGGGTAANLAEGTFLAGEAYNEMINDVDAEGNPMFTPEEAASHAAGVVGDNFKWTGLDILQYGLLFGGLGRGTGMANKILKASPMKANFGESVKGLTGQLVRRVVPNLPNVAAYASVEGLTEGLQETYQEWAKYKNIQQGKGLDHLPLTEWIRDSEGKVRPEIRDIFWSAAGLGIAMGGSRGYYDSQAERTSMLNEKNDVLSDIHKRLKNAKSTGDLNAERDALRSLVAYNVWSYNGDGSTILGVMDNMVKNKTLSEEVRDEFIPVVEEYEKNYAKHNVDTHLTEAGAKAAFYTEVELAANLKQQEDLKNDHNNKIKNAKNNIKDESKFESTKESLEKEYNKSLNNLIESEQLLRTELEDIYTLKEAPPIAKTTGKPDARYEQRGISKEKIEKYSQEAERKAKEEKERLEKGDFTVEEKEQKLYELSESEKSFDKWKEETLEREGKDFLDNISNKDVLELIKQQEKKDQPTITDRLKGFGTTAFKTAKDLGGKAVKGVQGLFGKKKEEEGDAEISKDKAKEIIEAYDKNQITSSAKKKLSKAVEEGTITPRQAIDIKGTGRNGEITNNDIKIAIRKAEKEKAKEPEAAKQEDIKTKEEIFYSFKESEKFKKDNYTPKEKEKRIKEIDRVIKEYEKEISEGYADEGPVRTDMLKDEIVQLKKEKKILQEQDVKKKDKKKVIPKTKEYQKQEESLQKGPRQIKKADIQKGRGGTYIIKTPEGDIKYKDFEGISDKYVLGEDVDIELRLKKPIEGQENVVEVNGKLYFEFDNNLYESEIEVVANGEVIGKLAQRDFKAKEPTTKAKKASDDRFIDKAINSAKGAAKNVKELLKDSFKRSPNLESLGYDHNYTSYKISGFSAYALAKEVVQKQFPGNTGYVIHNKLLDDYGNEATSLALGSTVLISRDAVEQTDLIHEAGHVYYGLMEDTPLMKRIKKLLPKTKLYKATKLEYPELILVNYNGRKMSLGLIYKTLAGKINRDIDIEDGPVIETIIRQMTAAEGKDTARFNELLQEMRVELRLSGRKELRSNQQKHLLEETFVKTLEQYSYGTVDAVIKDSKTQEVLKKDLIEFYKKIKNLTTDDEAKRFLDLSVDGVQNLDLEAAIKHVLLDFKSNERTSPKIRNSAYGDITRANKANQKPFTNRAVIYNYIAESITDKMTLEKVSNSVMKKLEENSNATYTSKEKAQIKEYVKAIYTQKQHGRLLSQIDKRLDFALGKKTGEVEDKDMTFQQYDDLNKNTVLLKGLSNFITKIVEIHNRKHPTRIIKKKDLLSELLALSKETMYDPYAFPEKLRNHRDPNNAISSMLIILDSANKNDLGIPGKHITNAKLLEIKSQLEGTKIETLSHNSLEITLHKNRIRKEWKNWKSNSKTVEDIAMKNIAKDIKQDERVVERIATVYNTLFKSGKQDDKIARYNAARTILNIILGTEDSPRGYGAMINKDELLRKEILFNNERVHLHNILFDHKTANFRKYKGKKSIILKNSSFMPYNTNKQEFVSKVGNIKAFAWTGKLQAELKNILMEGLIASRGRNYLSLIDNVEEDAVSIFNKENSLHNRARNIAQAIQDNVILDKNDFMHQDNNIFSHMLHEMKNEVVFQSPKFRSTRLANQDGIVVDHPFHFTVHSGIMNNLMEKGRKALSYKKGKATYGAIYPVELMSSDFFAFVSRYNDGIEKKRKRIIYDQPIAVFSDKSRRYYVESIAAHNSETRKLLLSKIEKNPAYKSKYKKGDRVFPFEIKNDRIVGIDTGVNRFIKFLNNNKEFFTDIEGFDIKNPNKELIENYLTSYIANRFMAQQFFVGDHSQADNEVDYMKRSAGAVAGHIVYDRNIMVEPVIIKDYYKDDNSSKIYPEEVEKSSIENDAMGYILPNQSDAIRTKYGSTQKVGNVFKFVYNYTEIDGRNKGKTTYLKFAVHVITPKMERENTYLKNIADVLRSRQEKIKSVSNNPGHLVIAASESAAKMFVGDDSHIYDISPDKLDLENINSKQDELYIDNEMEFKGLSGEGLGIQLELDKEAEKRFIPSQLYYNLVTNIINEDEKKIVNEMDSLRRQIMLMSTPKDVISDNLADHDRVMKERDDFTPNVTSDIYSNLLESVYDKIHPSYPYVNATHNSIATGKMVNKGTKLYTKGSIGYQSSSLGYDLKAYETGLYEGNKDIRVSEAIVPGYLKTKQGIKVGDVFIGTRIPSHGKVTSAVFVVKDFHDTLPNDVDNGKGTSVITIPAQVSRYWGSDLDGDAVFMNFKWNDVKLSPTQEEASAEKASKKIKANRFIDLYIELLAKGKKNETEVDIDFKSDADNSISEAQKKYGSDKQVVSTQLSPFGDKQMYEDNDPSASLVGVIAALSGTLNVFSSTEEKLPFKINIKGIDKKTKTVDKFYDDPSLDNNAGNWFGVAQLLNIALDNAKWQYANKLGLDMQSVFPYVMLRRLGYSLKDLSVMFNAPIVKKYMEYKRAKNKNFISRDSDIKDIVNEGNDIFEDEAIDFFKKEGIANDSYIYHHFKNLTKEKKGKFDGEISIDINNLSNNTFNQGAVIALLYSLERFNKKVVTPFSQVFTTHNTIEKNPVELQETTDNIRKVLEKQTKIYLVKGGEIFYPALSNDMSTNNIVQHSLQLFDRLLLRAQKTDIRHTPYMQSIINEIKINYDFETGKEKESSVKDELNFNYRDKKSEIINRIIINDLKHNIDKLNVVKDRPTLIREFKQLKEMVGANKVLDEALIIKEMKDGSEIIMINSANITPMTSVKEIELIRKDFEKLGDEGQDLIFYLEYEFNGFGLTGAFGNAQSFIPFFSEKYIDSISKDIKTVMENNQTKLPDYTEYDTAVNQVVKPNTNLNTEQEIEELSRHDNNFELEEPDTKAKKKVTADTSYNNDHLGGEVPTLTREDWALDKGIDLRKYPKNSDAFKQIAKRYTTYKNHLEKVRQFEYNLTEKPLSKYSLDWLYEKAKQFNKLDNSASKGVKHLIEVEIAKKVFDGQVKFLKQKAKSQNFKYDVPGEDGVPQEDLGNFTKWLQSNNMTAKRPEIQALQNEAEQQFREYILKYKEYKNKLKTVNDALYRSKMKGLSMLERTRMGLTPNDRYRYIYGNLFSDEYTPGTRLYDFFPNPKYITRVAEAKRKWDTLTREEKNYYIIYNEIVDELINIQNANGVIVPGMQMGNIEAMNKNGMFGLYNNMIDSTDYNSVKVYGTNRNGDKELKTFYEWKYDVYKNRTKGFKLSSGKEINELSKLKNRAKQLRQEGKHDDNTNIILTPGEYDALVNSGVMIKRLTGKKEYAEIDIELHNEYNIRRSAKLENNSLNINKALLEFIRGTIFTEKMGNVSVLTNALIGFNKRLDNPNAAQYLTTWWKEGFLERKQQESFLGKTGDKVIDKFVRLTSLRLLGLNLSVGMGNLLAGKYQELRKRGGSNFVKGESRYWMHREKSKKILKDNRIIEYSFDDLVHIEDRGGVWGKIEKIGYVFMDGSEHYIQGSAFLGMLTDNEWNNPESITPERAMEINHKIRTLHGEGYTSIDASMLSMYSYGRAILQFKKWFVTLLYDRLAPETMDRHGNVTVGSYRAAGAYVQEVFDKFIKGELKTKDLLGIYRDSSDQRRQEIKNYINGVGLGVAVLSLIAILEDDDDDSNRVLLKNLKKLSSDIFVAVDPKRFVDYTAVPAVFGTMKNVSKMAGEAARGDKIKRTGPKGERGESKAMSTAKYDVAPFGSARYKLAKLLYNAKN